MPGNETDTRLFSHQMPRPLTAHQMADALAQATDVPNRFANDGRQRKAARRAIEVTDPATREHDPRHLRPLPADRRLRLGRDAGPEPPARRCS